MQWIASRRDGGCDGYGKSCGSCGSDGKSGLTEGSNQLSIKNKLETPFSAMYPG